MAEKENRPFSSPFVVQIARKYISFTDELDVRRTMIEIIANKLQMKNESIVFSFVDKKYIIFDITGGVNEEVFGDKSKAYEALQNISNRTLIPVKQRESDIYTIVATEDMALPLQRSLRFFKLAYYSEDNLKYFVQSSNLMNFRKYCIQNNITVTIYKVPFRDFVIVPEQSVGGPKANLISNFMFRAFECKFKSGHIVRFNDFKGKQSPYICLPSELYSYFSDSNSNKKLTTTTEVSMVSTSSGHPSKEIDLDSNRSAVSTNTNTNANTTNININNNSNSNNNSNTTNSSDTIDNNNSNYSENRPRELVPFMFESTHTIGVESTRLPSPLFTHAIAPTYLPMPPSTFDSLKYPHEGNTISPSNLFDSNYLAVGQVGEKEGVASVPLRPRQQPSSNTNNILNINSNMNINRSSNFNSPIGTISQGGSVIDRSRGGSVAGPDFNSMVWQYHSGASGGPASFL